MRINVGLVVAASVTVSCTADPSHRESGAGEPQAANSELLVAMDTAASVVDIARGMAQIREAPAAQRRREHALLMRGAPAVRSSEATSFLTAGPTKAFVRTGDVVRPELGGKGSFDYDLPSSADGVMHVRARGVSAGLRMVGARRSPAEASKDGFLVYRDVFEGGHVLHRPTQGADEDFVVLDRDPGNSELAYELTLEKGVAGVRVVSNSIELLDAKGVPRARMSPPYLVDANRDLHYMNVEVTGCRVDTSPTVPWDRPVVAPGATACTIHLRWDAKAAQYPLLVDPSWSGTDSLSIPRDLHTATALPDGRVLVAGGEIVLLEQVPGYGPEWLLTHQTAEIYDPLVDAWTQTSAMHHHRQEHVAIRLPSRRVLVAGGWNPTNGDLASAELYDPATGTWTDIPDLPSGGGGSRSSATLLGDGSALVVGGLNYATSTEGTIGARYFENVNAWTASTLNTGRSAHTANLLPNGKVLVAGRAKAPRTSAEVFDPGTGTWTPTAPMGSGRQIHVSATLSNGKVLVAGGTDAAVVNTAELYDPSTQTWSATAPMAVGHSGINSALTLANGKILVAGGGTVIEVGTPPVTELVSTTIAELYDPTTGTWTTTSSLGLSRVVHTTTLLPNGNVLAVGGYRWHGAAPPNTPLLNTTATVEIYQP